MKTLTSVAALVVACGGAPSTSVDSGVAQTDAAPFATDVSVPVGSDCSEIAKLAYTVSVDRVLRSFDPSTLTFHVIGTLDCNGAPNALAVARDGTAYVSMGDVALWKVSLTDASCTYLWNVDSSLPNPINGLGFAADAPNSASETLYACTSTPTLEFGKIDFATHALSPIGAFTNQVSDTCPLSGNGAGDLFASFHAYENSQSLFAAVDKTNATIEGDVQMIAWSQSYKLPPSFVFWGGDAWFFQHDGSVARYRYAGDRSVVLEVPPNTSAGYNVAGAGVSTCAPLTPPH